MPPTPTCIVLGESLVTLGLGFSLSKNFKTQIFMLFLPYQDTGDPPALEHVF